MTLSHDISTIDIVLAGIIIIIIIVVIICLEGILPAGA